MKLKPAFWITLLLVFACIGAGIYGIQAFTKNKAPATQPVAQQNQPTSPPSQPTAPNTGVNEPQIEATTVVGGETVTTSPTPFQPSPEVWPPAPENDPRPTLVCAFNSFGSYFTCVQIAMMDNPSRPYRLVLKPYNFEISSGEILNPAEEIDQANQLLSGEVDILLNTPDILVNNDTGARIITEIDRSDGADITAIWEKW